MIRSSSHGGAVSLLLLACLAACSPRSGPTGPSADEPVSSYSLLARLHGAEVSSPSILVRAVEIGGEERAAIWAPAPATVRFADVPVGRSATLRFGIGSCIGVFTESATAGWT